MYIVKCNKIRAIFSLALILSLPVCFACSRDTNKARKEVADRINALRTRFKENTLDKAPLDEIREILRQEWPFAQGYACSALRDIGPPAKPAIDDLIGLLDHKDHAVQAAAARALGTISIDSDRAVDALINRLDSEWDVAWYAAESLGKMGKHARRALPALRQATQSENKFLPEHALRSIEAIESATK